MNVKPAHHTRRREHAQPDGERLGQAERVVAEEHDQVEHQQQAAAEVAERPAARGHPVALVLGRDQRQDRVVDDHRPRRSTGCRRRCTTAPSSQLSPVAKNISGGEGRAGPGEAGQQPLLVGRAVGDGAEERQEQRRQDRGDRDQPEEQRRREATLNPRKRDPAVRRPHGVLGEPDEVRREEDRADRGDVGAVGPVVPVPGLLLPRPVERLEVGDAARACAASLMPVSLHCPRSRSTSLSMSVRSVIRPSTPRSSSARISVGLVDGPDVHVQAGRVRTAYEPRARRRRAGRAGAGSAARPVDRGSAAWPAGRSGERT